MVAGVVERATRSQRQQKNANIKRAADVFVSCLGQVAVRAWWDWKGSAAKLWYLLQPQSEIDAGVDRQLRGLALGAWVRAVVPVRAQVAAVNVGFGELVSGMARRVAAL